MRAADERLFSFALDVGLLAFDLGLLAAALGLLALPFGLGAAALGLLALPVGLGAAAFGLLALVWARPPVVLALAFVVRDEPEPDLAGLAVPVLDLAFVDGPLLDAPDPSRDAPDPLLELLGVSVARVLRRDWASLAMRSPEALPLFSFRAAVARLTEAASLAAARAPRGLLAVVAIGSAEELSELLGLLPHGPDLAGQLAELLSGGTDLVSHPAQVHLLGHRDAQDLALRLGLATQ